MVAESRNSGDAERHIRIKSGGGERLTTALAAAAHDQRLAVPLRQGFHIVERTHDPQIHPLEIEIITILLAAMRVVFKLIGGKITVEFGVLAVVDTVGVDVKRDGIASLPELLVGAADTGSMITHDGREGFGRRLHGHCQIPGDRHPAGAIDLDIVADNLALKLLRNRNLGAGRLDRNLVEFRALRLPEGVEVGRFGAGRLDLLRGDHRTDAAGVGAIPAVLRNPDRFLVLIERGEDQGKPARFIEFAGDDDRLLARNNLPPLAHPVDEGIAAHEFPLDRFPLFEHLAAEGDGFAFLVDGAGLVHGGLEGERRNLLLGFGGLLRLLRFIRLSGGSRRQHGRSEKDCRRHEGEPFQTALTHGKSFPCCV